jgi:hypothetical protein
MARRFRPRKEFKFWLYHDLAEDMRLMEFIRFCKSTQQFACMVRNGLRLMWSLGEGNTDVLYELFPWLKQQAAPDTSHLEQQIADLKRMMLEQGSRLPLASQGLMKPAKAPPQLEAKTAPVADASAIADNFLAFLQ